MPANDTPNAIAVRSTSINLPDGCVAYRNGLELPQGLSKDDWLKVGRPVKELAVSAMWLIGDWLAYGHDRFVETCSGLWLQDGVYAAAALETGLSLQTLKNAKWVCAKLPRSRRRDLKYGHALEIVGGANELDYDKWVDRTVNEGLSTKALREQLRKSKAIYQPEPNDGGTHTFLETARQFVRDYMAENRSWSPPMRAEITKILGLVVRDLRGPV